MLARVARGARRARAFGGAGYLPHRDRRLRRRDPAGLGLAREGRHRHQHQPPGADGASLMPALDNISWDRIEKESAVTYPSDAPDEPGHDVVFGDRFPTQDGRGKLVPAKILPPDERPDAEFPFVLSTGRQLEHWHTGAMTRRASTLDALEPGAVANLSRGTIAKLGVKPGDMVRVTTRRS